MPFAEALRRLASSERRVLGFLVLLHWAVIAVAAAWAGHNGWLYYAGGDETWYYTTAWVVGRGELPPTAIGYGLPYLYAPVSWVAGPNILEALPWIVAFNVLVLAPSGVFAIHGIARVLGGRQFGLIVAAGWALLPVAGMGFLVSRYREFWIDHMLAQTTGLTVTAEYISMILVLLAAFLLLRGVSAGNAVDVVLAGLIAGFALGVKPSNAPFVLAAGAALLLCRRFRLAAVFATAVVPSLLVLAVWKARGLGTIPLLALETERLAVDVPFVPRTMQDRYLRFDGASVGESIRDLREYTYSGTLLLWLPVAGAVAWFRRLPFAGLLLALWLLAYLAVKGRAGSIDDATFFRFVMPAFPAFFLLAAATPLLVPRWRWPPRAEPRLFRTRWRFVATAAALLAVAPFVVAATARPLDQPEAVKQYGENQLLPVASTLRLRAVERDGQVELTWDPPPLRGARVYYRIFRSPRPNTSGVECAPTNGAADCALVAEPLAITAETRARATAGGVYGYRIGLSGDWRADPNSAPLLLLSRVVVVGAR